MNATALAAPEEGLKESLARAASFAPAKQNAIAKTRYSHQAMVDMIIANPWISQAELARNFGYTEGWVSQVIASDAFQAFLAKRKDDLIDPHIRATIEERFKGLVARSIEILMRKLDEPAGKISDELALKALEVASKAAGYGSKAAQVQLNQQFVVHVPPKAASSEAWHQANSSAGSPVSTPPASKAALKTVEDAVLVDSGSGELNTKALLSDLKGA